MRTGRGWGSGKLTAEGMAFKGPAGELVTPLTSFFRAGNETCRGAYSALCLPRYLSIKINSAEPTASLGKQGRALRCNRAGA